MEHIEKGFYFAVPLNRYIYRCNYFEFMYIHHMTSFCVSPSLLDDMNSGHRVHFQRR